MSTTITSSPLSSYSSTSIRELPAQRDALTQKINQLIENMHFFPLSESMKATLPKMYQDIKMQLQEKIAVVFKIQEGMWYKRDESLAQRLQVKVEKAQLQHDSRVAHAERLLNKKAPPLLTIKIMDAEAHQRELERLFTLTEVVDITVINTRLSALKDWVDECKKGLILAENVLAESEVKCCDIINKLKIKREEEKVTDEKWKEVESNLGLINFEFKALIDLRDKFTQQAAQYREVLHTYELSS
ncbi:MAG: hypothetical protein WCG10_06645 [Chlamydiota bacterium]